MEIMGNYNKRCISATNIQEKLKAGKKLTEEEIKMVCNILEDPLGEFCLREGTFRLVEILDVDIEKANSLEDKAAQAIRDILDCNQYLYDDIDDALRFDVLDNEDDDISKEDK